MPENVILKIIFQPAQGVMRSSLFHFRSGRSDSSFKNGRPWMKNMGTLAKTGLKTLKVSVSEHPYPVSIYILDFYCIGKRLFSGKVKVARCATFTSEGRPSLFGEI